MTPGLLPRVESWSAYRRVFGKRRVWTKGVGEICARHGIPARRLETTYPGTCIVLLVNRRRLVKLFPPFLAGDCAVEASALAAVRRARVRAPRVVARGVLRDRSAWPYLILAPLPGRPVREVMTRLPRRSRLAIMAAAGRILRRVHAADPHALPRRAALRLPELTARALAGFRRAGVFSPALLRDLGRRLPGLLRPAGRPRLVHGDLNEDHVLVARRRGRWIVTGLIDFADARLGDPAHEWMPVWLGLLGRDAANFRAFLAGFSPRLRVTAAWRDRAAASVLVHDFAPQAVCAALKADRVRSRAMDWNSLRDWLWPPSLEALS